MMVAYPTTGGLAKQAATPVGGFALTGSPGPILSWTAPNDGALHRVMVISALSVTSNETGGQCTFTMNAPDGSALTQFTEPGGRTTGVYADAPTVLTIQAGSTVSCQQTVGLTGGAAKIWVEIWGS